MEQHIKRLAVDMKLKFADDDNTVDLPIKEIDGVRVQVRLLFTYRAKACTLMIWVKTRKESGPMIYDKPVFSDITYKSNTEPKLTHYSHKDLITAFTNFHETLKKMRFDKFEGEMTCTAHTGTEEDWVALCTTDKVELNCEPCAVCHDKTKTTTKCGHYLCYSCWSHLKLTQVECEDCDCGGHLDALLCPICRQDMNDDDE